jgi:phosphoesterase RecJ-like protein
LLIQKIRGAETIVIFGHKNPDGDSLGAALGLRRLITDNFGKTADIIYDGNLPFKYDFMPGRDSLVYAEKLPLKKYDLAVSTDAAALRQLGEAQAEFFKEAACTIKIDHHKTGEDFADINIVRDDFVATSEIIYEIARAAGWEICADAANCLYVGIYADTGGFNHIDNGSAMRVAADLIDMGASARMVRPNLDALTRADIVAEAQVLSETKFLRGGRLAVISVPNKFYKKLDSGETPVLMRARSVRGVDVLVVLKEARPNEIHASFRSETFIVRDIAEKLGGGGHDFAAAAKLNASLTDAQKIIEAAFAEVF